MRYLQADFEKLKIRLDLFLQLEIAINLRRRLNCYQFERLGYCERLFAPREYTAEYIT